jgi:GDP-mannose 6-dehydrogenase
MRISVFGLGYVGSVTAACLARAGHEVIGVDSNPEKTAMINDGKSPVVEPCLGDLIADVVRQRRLRATVSADWAIKHSDIGMICVGTPGGPNGQLDTSALERVAEDIGRTIERRNELFTIVLRSTVLPGTTERIVLQALHDWVGPVLDARVAIAVNPEFMREGTSIADFERPPMTLVGCDSDATAERLRAVYRQVDAPFVQTSIRAAEMMKYVSNAFHALKICFANEIADVCESMGVDEHELSRTFLLDHKLNISEAYLRPGFAFGGSCLPKDVRALLYAAKRSDVHVPLLASIPTSNDHQIRRGIDAVLKTGKKRVAVVGLSFKAGTDDLRESPMVTLVESLIGKGCFVRIFDRNVRLASLVGANRRYIEKEIPHISSLMSDDLAALVSEAEVIVIGNDGDDSLEALAHCRPDQTVINLTRSAVRHLAPVDDVVEEVTA